MLSYLTCAHPGLLLQGDGETVSLQTRAGGLGATRARYSRGADFPVATREVAGGPITLCVFSDGFCLAEDGVTSWSHRIARECRKSGKQVSVTLAREFRSALRQERGVQDAEVDDKTLLMVTL